ncbi:hypothetical protein LJC55_01085 [Eubacteriales bacterium OttesenSCG-928-N14]|nr:hypothetical protein [Eubacteriales bacterium OttesenSCG-928-N14]
MSTTPVSYPAGSLRTYQDLTAERTVKTELGKDEFLQLLVMQLANQNPLEPVSDTDFIAQMAQFSALEQMTSLNSSFNSGQAQQYIGKTVIVETQADAFSEPELVKGKVTGVLYQGGKNYIMMGDLAFETTSIVGIVEDSSATGVDNGILSSANLIGKTVTAKVEVKPEPTEPGEEEGEEQPTEETPKVEYVTVSGVVQKVFMKDGQLYATIKLADSEELQDITLSSVEQISA